MRREANKDLFSDWPRAVSWPPDGSRTPVENLVEYLLTGQGSDTPAEEMRRRAEEVLRFDPQRARVVVLGGGTGLSTIVGGNSQAPDWPDEPFAGLKRFFPHLTAIVCTTDDGGSTGRLLQSLPMIGVGDIRKLLLSYILPRNLERTYALSGEGALELVRLVHRLFNHRFDRHPRNRRRAADPLLVLPRAMRPSCPESLAGALAELGACACAPPPGLGIRPAGHALGNLLLTAAIFRAAGGRTDRPPGLGEIQRGIDHIASLIGAPAGRILPATSTPGQLEFRYANGVAVYGQSKSASARRDTPVDRVTALFNSRPAVGSAVTRAIREADLILLAPGSLYTSIIPILQLEPITAAIRANRGALKILAANSWVQEGETDISLKNQARGFLVSELVEAYDRNVPQGIRGLFDIVLSANLEHVPGNILRNYALEGKSPIHLDRAAVEAMGVHPVEATLFSPNRPATTLAIHHDPCRFALAIRTLLYTDNHSGGRTGWNLRGAPPHRRKKEGRKPPAPGGRAPLLCRHLESIRTALEGKVFKPAWLRDLFMKVAWDNRDIRSRHLEFFRGVRLRPAVQWDRSTDWDNVLGYFSPEDRFLYLHEDLRSQPSRLRDDLLVALGESLLGSYVRQRRWIRQNGSRRYEIVLAPPGERRSFLSDDGLRTYLRLARMVPDRADPGVFGITINEDGGFIPPGLLFGLLFCWYLTGRGLTMEYEMTLLRWPPRSLIPLHAGDRRRKEALVRFFRTEIFGHEA